MEKENKYNDLKRILTGILVLFIFLFIGDIARIPFILLDIDIQALPTILKTIINLSVNALTLLIVIFIYRKDLKIAWQDMKKNNKEYFQKYLKYWFWVLGLTMAVNLIIQILQPGSIAGNEEAVREMTQMSPIYMFFAAVLIGPMLEELTFRQSFRYMFKNDTLFILTSGLVFGALHVVGNITSTYDLLYLISYSIPGWIFAYTLVKSKNIFVPIGLHLLHNGVLISLQIFLSFFL